MALDCRIVSEKMMRQLDVVRYKRVKQLKDRIGSGTYRVDNDDLVRSLFFSYRKSKSTSDQN